MSFLMNEKSGGAAGRRRVSQVSNDEWRAALQQQIEEKKLREQQQKRFRGYEDSKQQQQQYHQQPQNCNGNTQQYGDHDPDFDSTGNSNNAWDSDDHHQYLQQPDPNPTMRLGRRNVQQMSNDAWREALEQQIREKKEREQQEKQQRECGGVSEFGSGANQRRGQSAPGQDQEGSFPEAQQQQQQDQERAMTTPLPGSNANQHPQAQHGRRRMGIQTQEEYMKSLQDQLDVQKRFEQEALEFKKAQRQLRRKILIDDGPESKEVALPQSASVPATPVAKVVDPVVLHMHAGGFDPQKQSEPVNVGVGFPESKHSSDDSSSHPAILGNQYDAVQDSSSQSKTNIMEDVAPVVAIATDPVALAKIVDFCEELKRQNEEVKQQLVEQHSVLASLRSTLVVTKARGPGDKVASSLTIASAKSSLRTKKPLQVMNAVPRRKPGSRVAPPEEKKSHTSSHESKCLDSTAKAVAGVARPSVVRARPIRGESKIPFPSGVASVTPASGVLEAKATHEVAEPKIAKEEDREETPDDALKQTAPSETDITSDAKDTRSAESVEGCKPRSISKDGEREDTGHADATKWDEKTELQDDDDEDERSAAKSHQLFDSEENEDATDDEDHAEPKSYNKVREHKLDQEEENVADSHSDELVIIHSDSYLILDDEVGLCDNVDEVPLGSESKLLRCETSSARDEDDGEITSCSSFVLVDGASSLVSLDHSLGDVFSP